MARQKAWDKIQAQGPEQSLANRDIFNSQQIERSTIADVQTRTSRRIFASILAVLAALLMWVLFSMVQLGIDAYIVSPLHAQPAPVYIKTQSINSVRQCYRVVNKNGTPEAGLPCYATAAQAMTHPPTWVRQEKAAQAKALAATKAAQPRGVAGHVEAFSLLKLGLSLFTAVLVWLLAYSFLIRNLASQNLMNDTTDINQHVDDQQIAIPDEVVRKFDFFPDTGAHSDVQVSSMISHVMLSNKGLGKFEVGQRAAEDILQKHDVLDDEGNIIQGKGDLVYSKGELMTDDQGNVKTVSMPIIDEKFGAALFDASGLVADKNVRRVFDTRTIPYNADGSNRDKLGQFKHVNDLINHDWTFPEFEVQRPAGAYIVDTAPVNTMVLAITRAGKGQTYIEPVIDMWLREKNPSNMVINDPKGELLRKNYVRATTRGYQVVQFNLLNSMKTDIYNPLGMAAEAAREGDSTKCAEYVENIAGVFFPLDGGDDPVWPNAANNAFKRAAYGLIDFYLEEERELRAFALRTDMDVKALETQLDAAWGKVTLYNCYQLFVQLTAKKSKNPVKDLDDRVKAGEYGERGTEDFDEESFGVDKAEATSRAFMWDGEDELDMLTLYSNATKALPPNSSRTLFNNADNALRAMAGAEKMMASVYGIAITAMSFFTDPTISTLTSGTPSQNTDLGGLSFPRRMGVRFGMNYLQREHLIGSQARWDAFTDNTFTTALGKDFEHEDIVNREGWARYYFKGKFAGDVSYVRLRLLNVSTGMLIRTFYFKFTKDYQTSLNGRFYITDPISDKRIIKNGILLELRKSATEAYVPGHTTYPQMRLVNIENSIPDKEMGETNAIIATMVRYSESPKAIFLVTPPHLMKYAKLILILLKQLVDLNFDKSYMTKSNQKPLYRTRFMLDELGNLQSEGHGINGFETMLSIGLGQEQQFTLILQTLQQLRDVYGESVDKIVQGNAQPLDAKIATPTGWLTMGQMQIGTQVLTPAGGATVVDGVYPKGVRPVYRVTRRDGSSTEVCDEHLWEVIVTEAGQEGVEVM